MGLYSCCPVRNSIARTNDKTEGQKGTIYDGVEYRGKKGVERGLLVPSADDCNVTPKPSRRRKHIDGKKGGEKEE